MPLMTSYMPAVKNVPGILEAIKDAGVPPRFTNEFLKSLGFASSNDRAIINVLKGLGFLTQEGVPTDRYRQFRDRTQSGRVLADALREAYSDLFLANQKANDLPMEKLKGFFAAKTAKGGRVVEQMSYTFRALSQVADFTATAPPVETEPPSSDGETPAIAEVPRAARPALETEFHYNIQIHLPATRDIAVYNAIFRALRENLS